MTPQEWEDFYRQYQGVALTDIQITSKGNINRAVQEYRYRIEGYRAIVCRNGPLRFAARPAAPSPETNP